MPGSPANPKKPTTANLEPRRLRTSSQPTQQIDLDDATVHTPTEALEFLLAKNLILMQQSITYDNLATALLHIAEAQKIPKTLEESIHSISILLTDSNRPHNSHRHLNSYVGCIYASYPQCKSNILQCLFNSFKPLSKHQKLLKNIFLDFSVFLLTFVRVSFHFFCSTNCMKVRILLPPRGLIPSRGSAYRLIGST